MKTIELICGGAKTQFTTKSVTFNGTEYFYSNMTTVSHNANEGFYSFSYNGEVINLPYEEKDAKILAAIFNQVKTLISKKSTDHQTSSQEPESDTPVQKNTLPEKTKDITVAEILNETEKPAETEAVVETEPESGDNSHESAIKEEKTDNSIKKADKKNTDPEKKKKIKKSFIVFGLIIIICAIAACLIYAVFGSSDTASQIVPNATESQQYDDIDDIINDLQ